MAANDTVTNPAMPGTGNARTSATSSLAGEWPVKAADAVDSVVGMVHDKAVRPLILVARAVVFGLVVAVLAGVLVTAVSVGLIRLLDVYAFPGRVWASYALVGFVFSVAGLLAWSRRSARPAGSR